MVKMPVLFIGHGSPMNAIEENKFVEEWRKLKNKIPKPRAILSVSAHWFTPGTRIMTAETSKTIYDMYGFPEELYRVIYNPKGSPFYSKEVKSLINKEVIVDNTWGYDHGTWSVLCRIYPDADIPVFQLSVDRKASAKEHYRIGQELYKLREQGVLILGSGNVVHNLARLDWNMENGGYPWAENFDKYIYENILEHNNQNVIDYQKAGSSAYVAFTSMDHYAPLLYVLGATDQQDKVTVFNKSCVMGSLSMTSYLFE
jgi:4,5-DOPA dioxygenase extradiol